MYYCGGGKMYRIKFTKKSNLELYDCFVRALENLKPIVGGNPPELKQGLLDYHNARLLSQYHDEVKAETEYVFEFPDEQAYLLFLLKA